MTERSGFGKNKKIEVKPAEVTINIKSGINIGIGLVLTQAGFFVFLLIIKLIMEAFNI